MEETTPTKELAKIEPKQSEKPLFLKNLEKSTSEMNKLISDVQKLTKNISEYERGLAYGWYLTKIKEQITPEALDIICALMNTEIGFKTDRNPNDTEKPRDPYSKEVVKNCVVASMIHGLRLYGDEWNILGGNFYATKKGLDRVIHEHPNLERDIEWKNKGFKQSPDTGNWQFTFSYNFKKRGEKEVNGEVTVFVKGRTGKNNSYEVQFDSILGKAERKLFKNIYNKMNADQGFRLEDADDVDEIIETTAISSEKSKLSQLGKNIEQK